MKKSNFKKIIPLIGISTIGISAIISGAVLSINSVSQNNFSKKVSDKLFNYSIANLTDINILTNPTELAIYMHNYGVFGLSEVNPIESVDIISKTQNSNNCYNVDLRINGTDGKKYIVKNVETSVPFANEISILNFERLNDYFLHFNTIKNVYDSIYSNNNSLMNIITSYTSLTSEQISHTSINFSNNFNYDNTNTLSFELQIFLNSNFIYNGSNVISCILPTSIIIDWNNASINATKFFVFDDNGSVIGITELGLQNDVLIIPESYTTDNGDIVQVNSITSLSPTNGTNLSNIKAIILPNKIKIIGENAFGNINSDMACSNLKWINLPKSLSYIGDYAFANCTNLQNLSLYNQQFLISIGQYAFDNCISFTDIYLNDKVLNIGNYAFENCTNLYRFRLSNSLSIISEGLFQGCKKLLYIVIPFKVERINDNAFRFCWNLMYINSTYNLTYFGSYNLDQNKSLKNLVFLSNGTTNQTQFASNCFGWSQTSSFMNIYILGDYNNSNNFSNAFSNYSGNSSNLRAYVTSQNVYNIIANATGTGYAKNIVMVMDMNNPPSVLINNIPKLVKYWQDRITSIDALNSLKSNSYDQFTASVRACNVLANEYWISGTVVITEKTDSNGDIYAININFKMRNNQFTDVYIPLSSPISNN